jgi:hypothetical protein
MANVVRPPRGPAPMANGAPHLSLRSGQARGAHYASTANSNCHEPLPISLAPRNQYPEPKRAHFGRFLCNRKPRLGVEEHTGRRYRAAGGLPDVRASHVDDRFPCSADGPCGLHGICAAQRGPRDSRRCHPPERGRSFHILFVRNAPAGSSFPRLNSPPILAGKWDPVPFSALCAQPTQRVPEGSVLNREETGGTHRSPPYRT